MDNDIPRFSEAALAKQAEAAEYEARGERVPLTLLAGIAEPNPALPDCQSWDTHADVQCSLPNHHAGPHRTEVTW